MRELLIDELRDIYSAERQALRAYPRLRKTIRTPELREAVDRHVEQTKHQVERLDQIFQQLDTRSTTRGKICHAMQGLIEEAQEHAEEDMPPELMEVVMIGSMQRMEHYEIAAYGTVRALAEALELEEPARLLEEILGEEKQADELLNRIALEQVNPAALEAEDGDEDEDEDEDEDDEDDDEEADAEDDEGEDVKDEAPEPARAGKSAKATKPATPATPARTTKPQPARAGKKASG